MLVAVVILSISTLSITALQLVSKRNILDAGQRTQAAHFAYDIIEHLRANRSSPALRTYLALASPWVGRSRLLDDTHDPGCASSAPCNVEAIALQNLRAWEQLLDGAAERLAKQTVGGLTYPTACIEGPADGGSGQYQITITWRGNVSLPDNSSVACGRAAIGDSSSAPAGMRLYGDQDEYRRSVTIQAYLVSHS